MMTKTSRPHSDAVKRFVMVESTWLIGSVQRMSQKYPAFKTMANCSRIGNWKQTCSNVPDNAGMHTLLDVYIPLKRCINVLYKEILSADKPFTPSNMTMDDLVGVAMNAIEHAANSSPLHIPDDIHELLWEARTFHAASYKPEGRQMDIEGFERLAASALLKYDAAYRYLLSQGTIPYRMYVWLIEKKIPRTEAIVAVCNDYGSRWRVCISKMTSARKAGIEDDYTWRKLYDEVDSLILDWQESINILVGRKKAGE